MKKIFVFVTVLLVSLNVKSQSFQLLGNKIDTLTTSRIIFDIQYSGQICILGNSIYEIGAVATIDLSGSATYHSCIKKYLMNGDTVFTKSLPIPQNAGYADLLKIRLFNKEIYVAALSYDTIRMTATTVIYHIDTEANVLDTTLILTNGIPTDFMMSPLGNIYIVGWTNNANYTSYAYMLKTNRSGQVIWNWYCPTPSTTSKYIQKIDDNHIVIGYEQSVEGDPRNPADDRTDLYRIFFMGIDSNGVQINQKCDTSGFTTQIVPNVPAYYDTTVSTVNSYKTDLTDLIYKDGYFYYAYDYIDTMDYSRATNPYSPVGYYISERGPRSLHSHLAKMDSNLNVIFDKQVYGNFTNISMGCDSSLYSVCYIYKRGNRLDYLVTKYTLSGIPLYQDTVKNILNPSSGGASWGGAERYIASTDDGYLAMMENAYLSTYTQLVTWRDTSCGKPFPAALSIPSYSIDKNWSLYPNPVANVLVIKTDKDKIGMSYFIADISGREIISAKIESETNIVSLKDLSNGIYFLFSSGIILPTLKFVKQ